MVAEKDKEPLLTVNVPDTEEARAFLMKILSDEPEIRQATEDGLIEMLTAPLLQYARDQAVKIKQGKL
jgi:hypothetical protein